MMRRIWGLVLVAGFASACDCGGAAAGAPGCTTDADCTGGLVCQAGVCGRPLDSDQDGREDRTDNCPLVPNATQVDTDQDAQGDACDDDLDGDGVLNEQDNCPSVPNEDQKDADADAIGDACDPDRDGDDVPNDTDNCPDVANPNQGDRDRDRKGDACDDDRDGDGLTNGRDNCPDAPNPDQADLDGDRVGDKCDDAYDDDRDGIPNNADNCPQVANETQKDTDRDGVGDACDPDTDGDGVLDQTDNCKAVRNPDQKDSDRDGKGDVCDDDVDGDGVLNNTDNCIDLANPDQADGDHDGKGDVCDDDGVRTGGPVNSDCKLKLRQPFQTGVEWSWPGTQTLPSAANDVVSASVTLKRTRVMMTPAVGDINADGVTDVVFASHTVHQNVIRGGALVAVDGRTGRTRWMSAPSGNLVSGASSVAIGNLDNSPDKSLEIVAVRYTGGLAVYSNTGAVLWSCSSTNNCRDYTHGGMSWGGPSLADLDADGTPELVYGATAYKRQANGSYAILWDKSADGTGSGDNGVGPLSVVADLDLDGKPEVVTGRTAYRANGATYWDRPNEKDGFVAIGNFDNDAYPEVVVVADAQITLREHNGAIAWGPLPLPYPNAVLARRGGPPTVADFDGDGYAEVAVATNGMYAVFDTDGTLLWSRETQDYSSAATGSSVFDFEGDGWSEVVYNDERKLRVYDGETGAVLFEADNSTGTAYEYPVVADVDGDNRAEIVVAANPYGSVPNTGVTCYGDQKWVKTRRIWNQHSYHVTNVQDDGRVPRTEMPSWASGTIDGWPVGEAGGSYRANASGPPGGYFEPAADLVIAGVDVDQRRCQAQVTVRFWVENRGAREVPAGAQVDVYRSSVAAGNLVASKLTTRPLVPGAAERFAVTIGALRGNEKVIVVVNGAGTVPECASKGNNKVELVGAGCQ